MNLFIIYFGTVIILTACNSEHTLKYDHFAFKCENNVSDKKEIGTMEGSRLSFELNNMTVSLSSSYYANNLYEFDVPIIPSFDTLQIKEFEEAKLPFVATKIKSDVDLDYYRIYNVFFDTIDNMPVKILKPRIPYSHAYKVFVAEIPKTYKKHIGYKSLTIVFENLKNESDVKAFEKFYKSMKYEK